MDPVKRNSTADLLKGTAVILMIQVHIMELFALPEVFNSTAGKVSLFLGGPPAAPVFMAVMGWFIFLSRKTLKDNLIRALKLFAGGLLLNIALNFNLIISISSGRFDLNPWHYIFGADILTLAGLSIALLAFLKYMLKERIIYYVLMLAAILVLSNYLQEIKLNSNSFLIYIQAFLWGEIEWSYFPFFPWFAYPLTGFIFSAIYKKYRSVFSGKVILPASAFLLIAIIYTLPFASGISHNLPVYYHHDFIFYLWAAAFLIVWASTWFYINSLASENLLIKYLIWLGRYVTAAYVIQWILIGNTATEIYKTQDLFSSALWFAGITGMVSLLMLIYIRINNSMSLKHLSLPSEGN